MKTILNVKTVAVSLLLTLQTYAIDIPRGIMRTSEIDQVRTEAAESEVAVAFILFPEAIKKS